MDKSILEAVYASARELYEAGVMDRATLERFQVRCDIESGLADVAAGRVLSTEEVRSRLLPDTDG